MNYEIYMQKCLKLAKLAEGATSPNPLVGCIILDYSGNIISEGYHKKCGENHAERDALLKLTNNEANGGTLIVNLEPCTHFGKTPPCTDLIIERGIKRVVIGMRDVNPIVAGNGITKLQKAGIEVVEGILEKECKQLNDIFIKNMTKHETFVSIKTATTLDGKIAASSGSSKWITSEAAREEVKSIRKRHDAIMTSSSTVNADNPTMEHRKKIVLDRNLKTDFLNAKIYKNGEIIVFYDEKLIPPQISNINFQPCPVKDCKLDLEFILKKLYEFKIYSVLIESGGRLNGSALDYTDKIYQFIAPKILGDNTGLSCYDYRQVSEIADAKMFQIASVQTFLPDILITLYR